MNWDEIVPVAAKAFSTLGAGMNPDENSVGRQLGAAGSDMAEAMIMRYQQEEARKKAEKAKKGGTFGKIGQIAGTVIGGIVGGPAGAAIGAGLGSAGGQALGGGEVNWGDAALSAGLTALMPGGGTAAATADSVGAGMAGFGLKEMANQGLNTALKTQLAQSGANALLGLGGGRQNPYQQYPYMYPYYPQLNYAPYFGG